MSLQLRLFDARNRKVEGSIRGGISHQRSYSFEMLFALRFRLILGGGSSHGKV